MYQGVNVEGLEAYVEIGLSEGEAVATCRSARKKAPPIPNDLDKLPVLDSMAFESDDEFVEVPPEQNSVEIEYPPGLAGEIAEYIFHSSRMPVKSFAIAAALTTIAHLNSNHAFVGKSDTALNLYQCLIGDTGKGKEDPRRAIKRLIDKSGDDNVKRTINESMASGAAFLRSLERFSESLILIDEFGIYLQNTLSDRGSVHQKDFIKEIMIFYGLGRSFFAGKTYADERQNIGRIDKPYVNLIGTTTPLDLLDGITPKIIDNGFLNRILFIQPGKEYPINREPNIQIGEELKQKMKAVSYRVHQFNNFGELALDYEDGAHDLLIQLVERDKEKGQFANLWSRAEEQTIRVAGLLAIGDDDVIKRSHITWAWLYVNSSIKAFAQKLDKDLAENPFQKQAAKALDLIKNAHAYSNDRQFGKFCSRGLMPRGKLTKLLKLKSKEVDEVITYLCETRQISPCGDGGNKCYSVL